MRTINPRQDVFALAPRIPAAKDIHVSAARLFGSWQVKKRVFRHFIVCLHLFTDLFHSYNFIFIISLKYSVFKLFSLISI